MMASRSLLAALGVHRFGLFGSFVKNEQTAESDLDLLIEFKPGRKSFDNFMDLSFLLEEMFRPQGRSCYARITKPAYWAKDSCRG